MTRRTALASVPLLAASCVQWSRPREMPRSFAAFSLREAERRLKARSDVAQSRSVGGLRRLLGAVQDPAHDVILVGVLGGVDEPMNLDDFVAAMRA